MPNHLEQTVTAICLIDRVSRIWEKQIQLKAQENTNKKATTTTTTPENMSRTVEFDFDEHFDFNFE